MGVLMARRERFETDAKRLKPWCEGKLTIQYLQDYRRTGIARFGNGLAGRVCNPARSASWALVLEADDIINNMLQEKYAR